MPSWYKFVVVLESLTWSYLEAKGHLLSSAAFVLL
jgi:hypothetical protein